MYSLRLVDTRGYIVLEEDVKDGLVPAPGSYPRRRQPEVSSLDVMNDIRDEVILRVVLDVQIRAKACW